MNADWNTRIRYGGIGFIVLTALCFLGAVLHYTGGDLSMPLDDTYIYFTFAKNVAAGHFMSWTPGGDFSSASTCPLYPFLLAIGWGLGFKNDLIVLWALLIGVGCAVACYFLVMDLVRRAIGQTYRPWMGLLGGALFALCGFLMWGHLSGMEIPIFSVVLLAALAHAHAWMEGGEDERRRTRIPLAVWGSLLSVMRPEGLLLSALLAAILVARSWLDNGGAEAKRSAWWAALILPGIAWMLITLVATGHLAPAGMLQKSYLYEPAMTPYLLANLTTENIAKIGVGLYSGLYFYDGSTLGLTPMFLLGLVPALVEETRKRRPGIAWMSAAWFFLGSLSTMASLSSDDHHFRYQMPFYHIYLVWAAVGVVQAVRAVEERWPLRGWAVAVWFIGMSAMSLPRWVDTYAMNSKNIHDQQIRMAHVVEQVVPEDAIVAINDAGAIPYFSGRRTFDVVGLATEGQSRWFRPGPGSLYERFERMSAADRPGYFAIYPDWFYLKEILPQKIASIRLADNTICGGDEKVLFKSDWSVLWRGHRPWLPHAPGQAAKEKDRVDLADLINEGEHDFDGHEATYYGAYPYPLPGQQPPRTKQEAEKIEWGPVVADGGRRVSALHTEMSMNVTLQGKKNVTVVGRVECADLPGRLLLWINDEQVGEWRIGPGPGFVEPESLLPYSHIEEGKNRIAFEYEGEGSVTIYNLWFYQ